MVSAGLPMNSNTSQTKSKTIILLTLGGVIGAVIVIGVQSLNTAKSIPAEQAGIEAPPPAVAAPVASAAPTPAPAETVAAQEVSAQSTEGSYTPPGRMLEYTQSASGYPIIVGRKAVDYGAEAVEVGNQPVAIDESGALVDQEVRPIGRNGLIGNPSVDPPSSKGAAYGRAY